jgi:hypothetical protein
MQGQPDGAPVLAPMLNLVSREEAFDLHDAHDLDAVGGIYEDLC